MPSRKYRCRSCGVLLRGWLPWAKRSDGALLLAHLGQVPPDHVGTYLDRIQGTTQLGPIVAEAYELIEGEDPPPTPLCRGVQVRAGGALAGDEG